MEQYQGNKVGVATTRTSVHVFLPWQWHVCGCTLFLCNETFFLAKAGLLSRIFYYSWSRRLAKYCHIIVWPIGNNISTESLSHPRNLCHELSGWPHCLRFLWWWRNNMFPVLWLLFCLWGIVVDPCFICGHKPVQKILLVSLKMGQTIFRHFHFDELLILLQQSWQPSSW